MPWSPEDARKKYKRLTKKQSEVWSSVANSALENGDDEATAIKKANAAVNRMRKSEAMTEAQVTISEIGRSISTANMKTLKSSFKAMQDAMAIIAPLIAEDSDEATESVEVHTDDYKQVVMEVAFDSFKWEDANLVEAAKILAQSDSYDNIRYAVQHALRKRAISDALTQKVNDGSYLSHGDYYDYDYGCMPYIRDLYDGYVVYSMDGELYQCEYTVTNDEVTLGDPTSVQISYVPVSTTTESERKDLDVRGELIVLSEKAVRDDGTARICLISPGWGSSGYYSKEMLKRDGPKVFPKGLHMYMNHPTEEEDRIRPERDLRDLAGALKTDAVWEEASNTNCGPGLYADVEVFSTYKKLD